jgi:MFS family permease
VKSYAELLRTPGVARLLCAQLVARFPGGMLSLGLLIHIESLFHSYGAAGLVLASLSVGQAVAGPLTSRWMGAWRMRPVLILTSIVCATGLATLAFAPITIGVPGFMGFALLTGLSYPPIQPAVRTIYPKVVNSRQLTPLFSLDASAQEIIWVAGPVLVTFVATQISSTVGILLSLVFLVGGGTWFISSPEVGRVRIPQSRRRFGVVLARPTVLLITILGVLLVGCFAAIEAGVVSMFGEGSPDAGFVLAIFALTSLVGGLAFGHRPIGPWALARRMSIILVGSVLAIFAFEFWTISGALALAGLMVAPALAVMFAVVSATVRFSDTAEAYGWVGTGQLLGAALGSAVAGFLIDAAGPTGGFWTAAGLIAAAVIIAVLFRRALPDLRGREAGPIPDTEPVPVQPS